MYSAEMCVIRHKVQCNTLNNKCDTQPIICGSLFRIFPPPAYLRGDRGGRRKGRGRKGSVRPRFMFWMGGARGGGGGAHNMLQFINCISSLVLINYIFGHKC